MAYFFGVSVLKNNVTDRITIFDYQIIAFKRKCF